jgi:hypothetical protein
MLEAARVLTVSVAARTQKAGARAMTAVAIAGTVAAMDLGTNTDVTLLPVARIRVAERLK